MQDGLFASEAEAAAWLLTPEPEVRRWLCGLDVARLAPVMSNANDRMGAFPHLYADGVSLPEQGFAARWRTRAVDAGHWLYGIQPDGAVGGSPRLRCLHSLPFPRFWGTGHPICCAVRLRAGADLHTQHTAQVLADTGCTAPVYLCQVNYGAPDSRRSPSPRWGPSWGWRSPC